MEIESNKIGIGITTYNSEEYFNSLYESIPFNKVDEVVVVNGGKKYEYDYEPCSWIQHSKNYYPAVSRNDAINFLLERKCEHIFLIEDDMIIRDENIFDQYIKASKLSGLNYFSFVSTSWEAGEVKKRTPRFTANYKDDVSVSFYKNMCNEFTYHHYTQFDEVGKYDTNIRYAFDVELAYRKSKMSKRVAPFWYFADLTNSDDYIMNNPVSTSRLQSKDRPDGTRDQNIHTEWDYFYKKHGVYVPQIPNLREDDLVKLLKEIKL
jgi:glycosyltransferase involved in cell wall biosynthesis